jgi:hypothetical protein
MKLARLMPQLGMGLSTFCFITTAQAGIPVWSFAPDANFPPATFVSSTGTASVKYTVSNNSSKAHNLVIKPEIGLSQNGPCLLGPKGSASSTCLLSLTITGSALPASGLSGGPLLCQANPDGTPNSNECYQPSKANSLAITVTQGAPILSASTANLALSVNDIGINAALTGNPRQITITNNGDAPATGLSISYPTWPSGTTVNTSAASACTNGGTLVVGGSCTITVDPGSIATSGAGNAACTTGIAPIPGVVSVTASNSNQTSTNVVVLGYGCQYQSGYVYSVDDTTSNTNSIGGKVAGLSDVSNGIPWTSSNSVTGANSNINGIQNTNVILVDASCTGNTASCAAYQCRNNFTAGGYTDWYLPAICEEGYDNTNQGSLCGIVSAPTLQNMQSNLVANGNVGSLSGDHWSSTEVNAFAAWEQDFATGGSNSQNPGSKTFANLSVRCSRALTF